MKQKITLILILGILLVSTLNLRSQQRASWMQGKWGIMTHYLADWRSQTDTIQMDITKWNKMIDHFDTEGLAKQIAATGATYYILTIGQNSGYYLSPNAKYDKLTGIKPSKCSRRDLITDMAKALARYKIKLIAYLPSGAPGQDKEACSALEWQNNKQPVPNKEFQLKWEQVIREWSLRWGNQIAGWWFDGCYWPNTMYREAEAPNFASFAAAARAGNPNNIVAFNAGVYPRVHSITQFEDYTAGEINDPENVVIKFNDNGTMDGCQFHILTYLGQTWGKGNPRYTDEQVINCSKNIIKASGVITWDCPVLPSGLISEPFFKQLSSLGKELNGNK
ncbi:MAG: alpha-L-fucosidase [Prolixibacteraceae bacterium]